MPRLLCHASLSSPNFEVDPEGPKRSKGAERSPHGHVKSHRLWLVLVSNELWAMTCPRNSVAWPEISQRQDHERFRGFTSEALLQGCPRFLKLQVPRRPETNWTCCLDPVHVGNVRSVRLGMVMAEGTQRWLSGQIGLKANCVTAGKLAESTHRFVTSTDKMNQRNQAALPAMRQPDRRLHLLALLQSRPCCNQPSEQLLPTTRVVHNLQTPRGDMQTACALGPSYHIICTPCAWRTFLRPTSLPCASPSLPFPEPPVS